MANFPSKQEGESSHMNYVLKSSRHYSTLLLVRARG